MIQYCTYMCLCGLLQVTYRSCKMGVPLTAIRFFTFTFYKDDTFMRPGTITRSSLHRFIHSWIVFIYLFSVRNNNIYTARGKKLKGLHALMRESWERVRSLPMPNTESPAVRR